MARKRVTTIPRAGETYDVTVCPWCKGPAPIFRDRKGEPFARCSQCGCRSFGKEAVVKLGVMEGWIDTDVVWPPTAAEAG